MKLLHLFHQLLGIGPNFLVFSSPNVLESEKQMELNKSLHESSKKPGWLKGWRLVIKFIQYLPIRCKYNKFKSAASVSTFLNQRQCQKFSILILHLCLSACLLFEAHPLVDIKSWVLELKFLMVHLLISQGDRISHLYLLCLFAFWRSSISRCATDLYPISRALISSQNVIDFQ